MGTVAKILKYGHCSVVIFFFADSEAWIWRLVAILRSGLFFIGMDGMAVAQTASALGQRHSPLDCGIVGGRTFSVIRSFPEDGDEVEEEEDMCCSSSFLLGGLTRCQLADRVALNPATPDFGAGGMCCRYCVCRRMLKGMEMFHPLAQNPYEVDEKG